MPSTPVAMTDEPSILGNLPRSRPGRRSERRERAGEAGGRRTSGGASAAASPSTTSARKAEGGSRGRSGAGPPAGEAVREGRTAAGAPRARESAAPDDLIGGATRAAGQAATAGAKIASRLASGALRRLPRP